MKSFAFSLLAVASFFLGFFPQRAHASTPDYALMSANPYNVCKLMVPPGTPTEETIEICERFENQAIRSLMEENRFIRITRATAIYLRNRGLILDAGTSVGVWGFECWLPSTRRHVLLAHQR
jgi:hypothetical protein